MADGAFPYPPAPANVPPDLTRPTARYRLRVIVVLTSLTLFAILYLGLVAGSAYYCYWSFAPNTWADSETGKKELFEASQMSKQVGRKYNEALQLRKENKIGDDQFLRVLDRDVLPPFRAQQQHLAKIQGLPREEQQVVDLCAKSMELQVESWELLAKAIRQNDNQLGEQSYQKSLQSEQIARQFSDKAKEYYRSQTGNRRGESSWNVIMGILAGLLCLFLVKGFFKWRRADQGEQVEVTEKDQPVLFAFIRRLCQDTRAPEPHRVYLTPDVNAAVFYNQSLLSLFLPTPKNLIIGLGLVNQLNLSEFKAVLAHEFGHFSQNSMKLGSYVYMSNRVIGDVVFGRDWLDHLVAGLRGVDIRIGIFAWAFSAVMWVLRKTLQGLFRVINFANSALSRQMEFNADLVAVSVTGSDALVHGLARLDFANDALGQAWNDLSAAADRQLYSRDLYYHQTQATEYLRALRNNLRLGEPPALPDDPREVVQVFPPEDTSVPKMWATHPSNHDREVNAKRYYVRSPLDQRSPWILFQDASAVRERVTVRLYQVARNLREMKLEAPEVVQAFIDEEHAETTYHPRYHGLYDHRYIKPGDLHEHVRTAGGLAGADAPSMGHAQLYGEELKTRMEAHRARQEDYERVAPLVYGAVELTGKDFQIRGVRYRAAEAKKLLDQVKEELDQDLDWMAALDQQVFKVHYDLARQVGEEAAQELEERYRFHLAVQEIHGQLSGQSQNVQAALNQLAGKRELTQNEFHMAVAVLGQARDALWQQLNTANQLRLPALKNVTAGEPLGLMLLNRPLVPRLSGDSNCLQGEWINQFMQQLGEVIHKAQRIHFKSLGGILALQEKLAEQGAALERSEATASEVRADSQQN
jgi:Zn-dependent protease with chaperone function